MNPPNPWTVEFAVREQQSREQRAQVIEDREGEAFPVASSGLGHRRPQGIGHLLLLIGAWSGATIAQAWANRA